MYEYAFLIVSSIGMVLFSAKSCTEKQDAEVCMYYLCSPHRQIEVKKQKNVQLPLTWLPQMARINVL